MEENKESFEEEQSQRWITVLLVIGNIIVWTIVLLFISIAKVDALAVSPNSNEIYAESLNGDNPEYINIGQNQEYSLSILKRSNLFVSNFINLGTGVYKGTAYVKYYNMQQETCAQLRAATNRVVLSLNNIEVQGTKNITGCTISDNYATLKIEYSYTNMQTNGVFKLIYRLPNWNIDTKYTMSSTLDYEAKDYATNTDIENQTISIINNAIQNATEIISTNILSKEAIILAMEAATTQIQNALNNQNQVCTNYDYYRGQSTKDEDISGYLNSYGGISIDINRSTTTKLIGVNANKTYTITTNYSAYNRYCLYKKNKTLIECVPMNGSRTITITPNQEGYLRFTYNNGANEDTTLTGQYCEDRTEAEIDAMEEWWSVAPWLHESPDESDFDTTHALENDILDMADDIDLTQVEVSLDTNSSNWVWNTLTSIINSNAYVFGMIISILSIGIIKLVFDR